MNDSAVNDTSYVFFLSNEVTYLDYVDIVMSEALRVAISVNTSTPILLGPSFDTPTGNTSDLNLLGRAQSMVSKLPGFFFSSYTSAADDSTVLITTDNYMRILGLMHDASEDQTPLPPRPPMQELMVSIVAGASQIDRENLINNLKNYIFDDLTITTDTQSLVESAQTSITLLNVFFVIVALIAVLLCFIVLWLSFTANVNENSWEFGVLRSLGLTGMQVIRMYIYEAFCVVLTSLLLGAIIGLVVSITLTLQFNLFTELPFTFQFPYTLFFSVLGMSFIVAVLGSYFPSRKLQYKPIAAALKGQ